MTDGGAVRAVRMPHVVLPPAEEHRRHDGRHHQQMDAPVARGERPRRGADGEVGRHGVRLRSGAEPCPTASGVPDTGLTT